MSQPQIITASLKVAGIGSFIGATNLPDIPFDGIPAIDISKHSLRIIGVNILDLPGSDFNDFDQVSDEFNDFLSDPSLPLPQGINASNYRHYDMKNWPLEVLNQVYADTVGIGSGQAQGRPAAEIEYIYSNTGVPFEQFIRVVTYILGNTRNPSTQGFYGLEIECIPFETKEIKYGKGGNGRIIGVNTMADFISTSIFKKYVDALCSSMTIPTPPLIITTTTSFLEQYSGPTTYNKVYNPKDRSAGFMIGILDNHRGGHKIGKVTTDAIFNLADPVSTAKINSHHSYFAELLLHNEEFGRSGTQYPAGLTAQGQRAIVNGREIMSSHGYPLNGNSGGYFIIALDDIGRKPLQYIFLHELGHALSVTNVINPTLNEPHLQLGSSSVFHLTFANTSDTYKNWRGFGSGTIISFDNRHPLIPAHPSPKHINYELHSCPLIYMRGSELLPMPSDNFMGYPSSQVQGAGAIYREASFLGASCDNIELPIQGQVLLYEAFVSLVNEFAEKVKYYTRIDDAKDGFLMFNPDQFNKNLNAAKQTEHLFLKLQVLWAGIEARGGGSANAIDPTHRPRNPKALYDTLRSSFSTDKIKYDEFEFTQEEEYKLKYEDNEINNLVDENGNPFTNGADFFKRHRDHRKQLHRIAEVTEPVFSHVQDEVLSAMEFRTLKDVIEVVNGEPRRTFNGVAKYDIIASKAEGETPEDLENTFGSFAGENDAKIKSIFGGQKMAKQMVIKKLRGVEECKYVYVVVRPASDLSFKSAELEDDTGRKITIS